jgi:hypothetical protein
MTAALSRRPLRLPTVSRDALSNRNVLCRRRAPMFAEWLGEEWLFDFATARAAAPSQCYVECDWGGARVFIGIDRASLNKLAGKALPGDEPSDWPTPILLAAL